ncbi:high affinity cationic amino acid transporter 1-like [Topomyia yanbarensis]|uniref:high affinity cationic amino acid transporter 1-like n=1 Tax=Topomyia yanbarensis TaxID=2498891 RepID=UPI00273AD0FA|nr:high affinity cationic amino acid transporter 1-like [Topomyia yanbarensis]XP_058828087.1 high affinity cationic amino acid transporter 1-like [Topomyia yanbarensis]XP_058828088.1 high affinity cationic amino acid transporter 1-like [Topomyia yanbarensis]XP_058828089.1 high affinity cationic amino acid transporter 1-like [Topomyia yanbarensis]
MRQSGRCSRFWAALTRKKRNEDDGSDSQLARVLSLLDLTGLGVGSTLGLGVYVLAGSVAHEQAGPAVVVSFLVAAVASAIAALCYAEFAARVPKAGSAYIYSYVSIGEFAAFTIGWNLILEYVIGTSSVARGMSGYIDALIDYKMSKAMRDAMGMNVDFLSDYPDFFSFTAILILSALLAYGVKESTLMNNIFTGVNLCVIAVVLVTGGMNSDTANWNIRPEDVRPEDIPAGVDIGQGGFAPYGFAGIMAGAAKCFYGFVGFDCIATTGEEAKNPSRNIPLAIVISLIIIFFAYFGISTVLTMALPYYLQDPGAPFPHLFEQLGWHEIKWIVSIGAIFALCTSLLGAMFPLPRVLYAMSNDGVIYKKLQTVHPKTQTPILATVLAGLLAATMALLFNLQQLIDMMSIGTLMAYTIVAVSVLILRYEDNSLMDSTEITIPNVFNQLFNTAKRADPTRLSAAIVKIGICLFAICICAICSILVIATDKISTDYPGIIAALSVLAGVMILLMIITACQPTDKTKLTFKVPLVPLLPMLSVFFNLYLMFQLDSGTWIRFAVWVAIGYFIYFTYGIRHSVEGEIAKQKAANADMNGKNGFDNNGFDAGQGRIFSAIPDEHPRKPSKNSYTFHSE